jgi:hypothetical protein
VIDEGYELRLPSGARIGHRSLRRYYKQYIRPQDVSLKKQNDKLVD